MRKGRLLKCIIMLLESQVDHMMIVIILLRIQGRFGAGSLEETYYKIQGICYHNYHSFPFLQILSKTVEGMDSWICDLQGTRSSIDTVGCHIEQTLVTLYHMIKLSKGGALVNQ